MAQQSQAESEQVTMEAVQTDMFGEKVSRMPLTGFFCNGEIGPVGGTTFLHGYTSSFGIFRTPHRE